METNKFDLVLSHDNLHLLSLFAGKLAGQATTGRKFARYRGNPRFDTRAPTRPLEQKSHARRLERRQTDQKSLSLSSSFPAIITVFSQNAVSFSGVRRS
jgi:hypothetical protein